MGLPIFELRERVLFLARAAWPCPDCRHKMSMPADLTCPTCGGARPEAIRLLEVCPTCHGTKVLEAKGETPVEGVIEAREMVDRLVDGRGLPLGSVEIVTPQIEGVSKTFVTYDILVLAQDGFIRRCPKIPEARILGRSVTG